MTNKDINQRLWINQSDKVRSYARRSYELAKEAYDNLEVNSLPWAFAVNHLAYVGVVTDYKPEESLRYLEILLRLKPNPAVWSPRFDDTIGTYHLILAEREWYSKYEEAKNEDRIKQNLQAAKKFLLYAKDKDPGDIDVEEHLERVDLLAGQIPSGRKRARKNPK